jgi:hypothetical protein
VLTFTSLLRKKMPEGSQDAEDLDLVIRETKRCAGIIRRLLDFAREKVPDQGLHRAEPLIEEVVRFVDRPATLQNIEIRTELDPELPQVWGDADLIKQVVLNIVVNATQAIADDGRIVVRTRCLAAAAKPGMRRRWSRSRSATTAAASPRPICNASSTLLHDQGGRQGHRAGLVGKLWHRQGPRRRDQGRKHRRRRDHLPHPAADLARPRSAQTDDRPPPTSTP